MKRTLLIVLTLAIVVALGATLVSAQGRWGCGQRGAGGPGKCGMMGGQGMGMGPGGRAMMGGQGRGMGPGGCLANVQPQTPAEAQFVQQVRALYDRICAEQAELVNLQAANGNANRIAALGNDLAGLRTRLHEVLWNNKPLMQQMGVGYGPYGRGMGKCISGCTCPCVQGGCAGDPTKCANCPCKDKCPCFGKAGQCVTGCTCPCAQGSCMSDPAKCADCPCKDNCPCNVKAEQCGTCPMRGECPAPCKQNCPAEPTK